MTDLGYYGLEQDGFKLLMPIKKKKNIPLFDVEKKYNKMIGKIRVVIEHINSQLKTFRILSERYRNRRKRFGLRINLIAALVKRKKKKKRLSQEVYFYFKLITLLSFI